MPFINPEINRIYQKKYRNSHKKQINIKVRQWAKKNPDKIKKNRQKIFKKNMDWFLLWLGSTSAHCDRCKYNKSFTALHIHHRNPKQKESDADQFSYWVKSMNFSKFQEKILNTDFLILCANCHAELHAGLWQDE
ncbi:MAG: hypothetical protein ABIC04_06700 [Nanoarchaeota archaeon]